MIFAWMSPSSILASRRPSVTYSTSCSHARISRTFSAPTSPHRRVTFSQRCFGVVGFSCRMIVDVERAKDEKLEVAAKRLARKLKKYVAARR